MKYFIIIIIIIILLLLNNKVKENFNGMSYIKRHQYLRCCSYFGCGHPRCQNFLRKNSSPIILMGIAYAGRRTYNIYGRKNMDSRQYEYFIRIYNRYGDYFMRRLNVKYLNDGDNIVINNENYTVTVYKKTYSVPSFNQFYIPNLSRGNRRRLNFISQDFKKQTGRNRRKYNIKMGKLLNPLRKNKNINKQKKRQ